MTYRIAICDDEQEQIEYLRSIISGWSEKNGFLCNVEAFPSAEALLFAYEGDGNFDILLLDVEMKELSGIALAKHLRAIGCRTEIIFITSHFEFVGEGYEVDALHYLIKPVAKEKLCEVLYKAAEKLAEEPPHVVISCEGETVKLYESDILYVESFLHDIVIHTKNCDYKIKESISAFEQKISEDFFRVHRSYLVNLKAVTRIGRSAVTLCGKTEVPVARGKYDEINRAFISRN